jgi:hypothetical protein
MHGDGSLTCVAKTIALPDSLRAQPAQRTDAIDAAHRQVVENLTAPPAIARGYAVATLSTGGRLISISGSGRDFFRTGST